ncbi:hypothetical protein V7O66_04370 [Methanolobus sp. ZRKC3]|uniref:hypothetical protein n=1 Tax=Methanolobus sp. ZRKC3 TaxID=3125786 RepID=UPI00324DAA20
MPRKLSEKDIELLKKLAPECAGLECSGSSAPYRSLLPPLSNHFSTDVDDFKKRISRLSDDDLDYLLSLIRSGEESLGCVPPHYIQVFLAHVEEKLGTKTAKEILGIYTIGHECPSDNVISLN